MLLREGVPITHADANWREVSWVLGGNVKRRKDDFIERFVMFPDKDKAELAVWAMRQHQRFIEKLLKRSIPLWIYDDE